MKRGMFVVFLLSMLLFSFSFTNAFASVINIVGQGGIYAGSIEPDARNGYVYVIPEKQNYTLSNNLTASIADPGFYYYYPDTTTIGANTTIDSYLILHMPMQDPDITVDYASVEVTFSGNILGLMITSFDETTTQWGNQLGDSDFLALYENEWNNVYDYDNRGRRLELRTDPNIRSPYEDNGTLDPYWIKDSHTAEFYLPANYKWSDQIRVITENQIIPNPEPATLILMGAGMSCLAGFIKRRRRQGI